MTGIGNLVVALPLSKTAGSDQNVRILGEVAALPNNAQSRVAVEPCFRKALMGALMKVSIGTGQC